MKKKIFSKVVMTFITVCATVMITLHTTGYWEKGTSSAAGIYSATLYNTVSKNSFADEVYAAGNVTEPKAEEADQNSTEALSPAADISDTETPTAPLQTDTPANVLPQNTSAVNVYFHKTDTVSAMPIEEYVACVIAAEMPADSPSEALKAQAVAARTLAVNYILEGDRSHKDNADICTDSGHCQSFISKEDICKKYGEKGEKVFENAKNAANATKGLVLLYNNHPIVAVFHASSGVSTASGKEVWGGDLAYLRAVETSEIYDEELSEKVISEVTFTRDEIFRKLSACDIPNLAEYKESPFHLWIGEKELTESGRVKKLTIAGKEFSGAQLRKIFGLRSTAFDIGFAQDSVTFITRGYGHGVGMSQLGAVAMAKKGESFYSILSTYYPGTVIGII